MDDVFHREKKQTLRFRLWFKLLKLFMQRVFHSFGMSEDANCELDEQFLTNVILILAQFRHS